MGIYRQTGSKNYWMIKSINGVKYRKSTETDSKMRAKNIYEDWVVELKESIKTGKPIVTAVKQEPLTSAISFYEMIEKYLEWAEPRQKGTKIKGYVFNTVKTIIPDMPLLQVDNKVLEKLQTAFIQKGYSIAYNNKAYNTVKAMLSKAFDWDLIDESDLKKARKAKLLKGENKRLRYLTEEESETLISNCEPYLKPIVITALNSGMRKTEIFQLTWDRIDLKNRLILLDKTKNGERREVPINDTLYRTLSGITRHLKTDYVFYNPQTLRPFDKLKESWARTLKKSHILDFHFHDLRHTFASRLVMKGADLTTVKELLGHKDIKMTLRYAHLAPAHVRNAVNMLDDDKKSYFGHSEEKMKMLKS